MTTKWRRVKSNVTMECQISFHLHSFMFKKRKDNLFPFLFAVSKYIYIYKKVKILTPIISNKTMQSNSKCIQQSPPPLNPLTFASLYNCVINNGKLNGMCLAGKFHLFTKDKKPNNKHAG